MIRIGTRGSALALAQARWVAERVDAECAIVEIRTSGDAGARGGDKSRWVDAIEAALVAGEIDLAVHSAKDMPGDLADGLMIAAVPAREDPRDVRVGGERGRVGTSSLRRRAQLLALDPETDVVELRGNVDTRLRKLREGEVDALVLAAAGLARLGVEMDATPLGTVPAAGQGCLALESRIDDEVVHAAVAGVHDPAAGEQLRAERAAVQILGATCHTAVGVHSDGATLRGFAGAADGSAWLADELPLRGLSPEDAGRELAERMLAAGARQILGLA